MLYFLSGGLFIFVKWDDCIGFVFGGNKVCKLEFLLVDVEKE